MGLGGIMISVAAIQTVAEESTLAGEVNFAKSIAGRVAYLRKNYLTFFPIGSGFK